MQNYANIYQEGHYIKNRWPYALFIYMLVVACLAAPNIVICETTHKIPERKLI